jgi:chorismate mutase
MVMQSSRVLDRIDSLIDDLLNTSDVSSSSLASMLTAVRDSLHDSYHVALARRIWNVNNRSVSAMRRPGEGKSKVLESSQVLDRIDALIDDLLNTSDVSSSSLASMLTAVRDSLRDGFHVAMARRIWNANNDLKCRRRMRGHYRLDIPVRN